MKKTLLVTLFIYAIAGNICFGQCAVVKETLADGLVGYNGKNTTIYENEDFENGLQRITFQLVVAQRGKGSNLLKFVLHLTSYSTASRMTPIANNIEISFSSGEKILMKAAGSTNRLTDGITINETYFKFMMNEFMQFQSQKIVAISINSNAGNVLTTSENLEEISKQANCIALSIN